ncbi:MFS transporter [Actinorhabdospora filicis]|uniref:MFS transporter n=1 Tax=Actinorhabdospora filicis TaxID=1785913 RepID=A0A9W6W968_9ACTN|nr:MFS transporter [Actinorhabdospora filicis]
MILLVAQAMAVMDNSIVAVATKTIRDDLNASGASIQLILSGYTLAFAVLVVTGARLGDDHGQRKMFLIGLAGFTIASLLCGVAPTAPILIAARLLQGVFGAMMVPQVLSSIQLLFTGDTRSRAIGYYSMVLALGVAAGQILGGLVVGADLFGQSWRVAFLINVPIGIVLFFAARPILPKGENKGPQRLDLVGVVVLAVTMIALVTPLVFGRGAGWPAWTWALLATSLAGFVAFVLFEKRLIARKGRPLLDLDAVRPPGVRPGLLACCLLNFAFAAILFTLTLHLQTALHYTPIQAGLMFVPMPVGFASVSLTWTKLPKSFHRVLPVVGMICYAGAAGGLALTARAGWPLVPAILLLALAGAGMAAGFSTLVAQMAETVGPTHASAISALVSTGTLLFSVLSVAGAGSIYLAFAEDDVSRSAQGVGAALGLVGVLLLAGAGCAARTWYVSARAARVAQEA